MDPITQQTALASAGGKKGPLYVDDVFSTFLYKGNSSNNTTGNDQPIDNGIDLSGEGGMVWTKERGNVRSNHLYSSNFTDINTQLSTDNGAAAASSGFVGMKSFNNNGFTLGPSASTNYDGSDYASWTFRKAPGFVDVVTFSGSNSNQQIPHTLGSVPGFILVKKTNGSEGWYAYHKDAGWENGNVGGAWLIGFLNDSGKFDNYGGIKGSTFHTDQYFTVDALGTGNNFVAYIFAHDDAVFGTDEDESIIKCGSYTGNGGSSSSTNDINLGFEPQWILIKSSSNNNQDWLIADTMRGSFEPGSSYDNMRYLRPNKDQAEGSTKGVEPTSTGFKVRGAFGNSNGSGQTYIYMAIRRPNKPPEAATEVFAMDTGSTSAATPTFDSGFPVDLAFLGNNEFSTRLTDSEYLYSYNANAPWTNSNITFDSNVGWGAWTNFSSVQSYMLKRAPGFMDVVAYAGTVTSNSDSQTVPHNLGVTPELMFIRRRGTTSFNVYNQYVTNPLTTVLLFNEAGGSASTNSAWGAANSPTAPNANYFTVGYATGTGFISAGNFVAYLFATLPGISKVGSYTGNTGNAINVDCGFTNGARFIMIKRTDSAGDWYYWDTLNGIVSGNDSYNRFNLTPYRHTGTDYVDPLSTGFTVTSSAPAALNYTGGTYLFLAIA